jgi:phosphoribosyl-ATP pyrophosphohydrolase
MEKKMRFRPKMIEIVNDCNMDPFVIIPKNGGLKDIVSTTLKDMGLDLETMEPLPGNQLTDGTFTVLQYNRGEDVPRLVEDYYFDRKIKAIGFTGDDLFDEYMIKTPFSTLNLLETVEWIDPLREENGKLKGAKYTRPALCILTRQEKTPKGDIKVAVNRKYEQTSRLALEELKQQMNINPEIRVYNGNLEATLASKLNDMAIEIVYSGTSVIENNLQIVGKPLRCSDFSVIGVNESSPRIFSLEYNVIQDRLKNPKQGSYTNKLASDPNKAAKKLGEEFAEYMQAVVTYRLNPTEKNRSNVIEEYKQLQYVMSVNSAMLGITFSDIAGRGYKDMRRP